MTREEINAEASRLVQGYLSDGFDRDDLCRVLTAATRKMGKLGIKRQPKDTQDVQPE